MKALRFGRALALLWGTWAMALLAGGCRPSHAPEPPAVTRDVLRVLPPGARYVVSGRADRLRSDPATATVARAVLRDDLRIALARRLGADPGRVERFVYATYEPGFVLLLEGASIDAPSAVRGLGRSMNTVELETDVPYVRRVGFRGTERLEAVALAPHLLALGGENGGPMVELLARWSRPGESGCLFDSDDGRALLSIHGDASLAVLVPSPLPLPVESGIGLLLARHRTLGVSFRPESEARIRVLATLSGELPQAAEGNLEAFARDLALSDLGDLLGMRAALPTLRVHVESDAGRLELSLAADDLARGLADLLVDDLRAIGGNDPPSD